MMLRSNGEYFDFNESVEMEERVKLFEQIDETLGDFSYSFNLTKTAKNLKLIGNPFPDVKYKAIYHGIECDLLDDSGNELHRGTLKVERINNFIECSFFSGNYNWFALISGPLSDIDFSDFDTEINRSNIANSWDNTEGIIFPLFDTGALITRAYKSAALQDFSACIFVKTIFKRIFQSAGIKTEGELLEDAIFQNLILSKQNIGPDELQARSTYAAKISGHQSIPTQVEVITFDDDSNFPYYDGSEDNYSTVTSRFTADVRMRVKVNVSVIFTTDSTPGTGHFVYLIKNGTSLSDTVDYRFLPLGQTNGVVSFDSIVDLNAGEFINVVAITTFPPVGFSINTGSTFKVSPTFIFFSSGNSLVPAWTKQQLVSNILSLFCVISDYNPYTKTVTFNLFEKIKDKEPVDLSEHLTINEVDYEDFVSNFFQNSMLTYQESNDEEIEGYDNSKLVKYGAGVINVNNKTIEESGNILESDFKAPVSYVNGAFAASLERTNFIELEEKEEQDFTSITDFSSYARFNVVDSTIYEAGNLVRISQASNLSYNGDYIVWAVSAGWVMLRGADFLTDATGVITKLEYKIGSDDGVYLFINAKYKVDLTHDFSEHSLIYVDDDQFPNIAYPFFNILNTGRPINQDYKQGLSFGSVGNPLSYQRTLIDKYWGTVGRVLNDPVKLICEGHIPNVIYRRLTPLRPVRIKTSLTNNLYYENAITGYKGSSEPCEVQLIKLS